MEKAYTTDETPEAKKDELDPLTSEEKLEFAESDQQEATNTKGRRLEDDSATPYSGHCRPDAEIWRRYLKETEIEDKELTQLWGESLDALLVFVSYRLVVFRDAILIPEIPGRFIRCHLDRFPC